MAYDANNILIDGTIVLTPSTDTPAVSTTRDASTGAAVIDLGKTSYKGLCAVLTCPLKPTTYVDDLTVHIQESDVLGEPTGLVTWQTVASFPKVYALLRELTVTATTAFVASDVGRILTATTDSASDGGLILWFDPALLVAGGVGKVIVQMSDANDDYSTAGDTVTATSGTGVGTQGAAAVAYPFNTAGIPGRYVTRFTATKRYVRANATVSSGGSYGLVSVLLTDEAAFPAFHLGGI
jgi:hypothetical protein